MWKAVWFTGGNLACKVVGSFATRRGVYSVLVAWQKNKTFTGTKCLVGFGRPLRFEYEAEEAPRAQCKFLCPKNLLYATHAMHPCRNMNSRHEESKILREQVLSGVPCANIQDIVQTCIPGTDTTPTRRSSASFTLTQLRELVGSYWVVACSCYVGWTNQMSLTPTLHYYRFGCRFPQSLSGD